jgi:hypothetical protein
MSSAIINIMLGRTGSDAPELHETIKGIATRRVLTWIMVLLRRVFILVLDKAFKLNIDRHGESCYFL